MRRTAAIAAAAAITAFGLPVSGAAAGADASADGVRTVLADGGGLGERFQIDDTQCSFPSDPIAGTPWSLQRIVLDQLWQDTQGLGVMVAVIDTGVDDTNRQLAPAIAREVGTGAHKKRAGLDFFDRKHGDGTKDDVGHGTKVAGIIAARPAPDTGFVGIAPRASILAIRQNDNQGGGTVGTMTEAIRYAVRSGAKVINISQDTASTLPPDSALERAVDYAKDHDVLIVASAGNDGADGKNKRTYPASYDGVLAVGASDRDNARANFSQPGPFVGVAAPGVDMVSTVPYGGHCIDQGTSFSAPYVAGVAALIRAKHPDWGYRQVITQIEQTADRGKPGRDDFVGWGVVDPVAAVNDDATTPQAAPTPDPVVNPGGHEKIEAATVVLGETPQQRTERYAVYTVGGAAAGIALLVGGGVVLGDWRRKRGINT
ncbi:type VII secretion-associated serine protease mycosin [Streptomyces sp. NPDC088354]|uniref:type VII secretion-associated serine protease mycosin n=1 Tax=unclassified Streptomyces TaxID=2593676 RepID=UPI0029B589F0|nr:type VII secretion-associated serine protease mycosin [Streptomyces sp. MI02-7b]MDX3077931.1 type VII secretion-associated serine protease mycosin [Streptomyces sp. MI02-7b]